VRHCDWESVTLLQLACPPGRVAASDQARNVRQYLRDPERGSWPTCRPRAGSVRQRCPPTRGTPAFGMAGKASRP